MAEIPFTRRLTLLLIVWAVGLVAAGFPNPVLIVYTNLFPVGLRVATPWIYTVMDRNYIIVGWLLYMALTLAALLSRPRILFVTFYRVLCVLLVVNVVGCQYINAHWGSRR